ncbi:MAG: hypothetical protein OXB95_02085, partial [Rhodobacteraceae bacterium]|nr:hypothetical protein [Paracoccaceae bacterium]
TSGPTGAIQVFFDHARPPATSGRVVVGHARMNYWYTVDNGRVVVSPKGAAEGYVTIFANEFSSISDPDRTMTAVIIHELMHTLGAWGHVDGTIMAQYILESPHALILTPIDRNGLLAMYDRLQAGLQLADLDASSLGSWSDTSSHLKGEFALQGSERASFGVASANGFLQPWAEGPEPNGSLANNANLSGTVTWSGALLGFTRTQTPEEVVGTAELGIDISTLAGQLDFADLKNLNDVTWGSGSLQYQVVVTDNTFSRSDGDDGSLSGAFVGASHEGMVGALERSDLAAGFGGKR